jgi:hypothetical protein
MEGESACDVSQVRTQLTAKIAGIDLATLGSHGSFNMDGDLNLTSVSYSGTNADLIDLQKQGAGAGVVVLGFQFLPAQSLTSLAAAGSDRRSSYSGSISSIPEPSGLTLLGVGALAFLGYGARRRRSRIPR